MEMYLLIVNEAKTTYSNPISLPQFVFVATKNYKFSSLVGLVSLWKLIKVDWLSREKQFK
jgi:hypothetical protein